MAFTPAEIGAAGVAGQAVVVIDVLRAASTMVEALVNGARDVLPSESVEQAVKRAQEIGRDQALLCGERDVERISGFELGNSPLEFTPDRVAGRTLVMTTTNGTRALLLGSGGKRCLVASLLNASAVADALAGEAAVLLLCAGREGRFAAEDALCAGVIARRIAIRARQAGTTVTTNDASRVAMLMAARFGDRVARLLPRTAAGRSLVRHGRGEEVAYCARLDRHRAVPRVADRRVVV